MRTMHQTPRASNRRLIGQDKPGTHRSLRITRSASAPDPPLVAKFHQCCICEPPCEAALRTELLNAHYNGRALWLATLASQPWSFETKALWIGNITVIVLQCSILICPLVRLSTTRRGPHDAIPNLQIFLPCKRSVGGTDGAAGLGGG